MWETAVDHRALGNSIGLCVCLVCFAMTFFQYMNCTLETSILVKKYFKNVFGEDKKFKLKR